MKTAYERVKEWRAKNKEKFAAQQRRYYLRHKDKIASYQREYRKKKHEGIPDTGITQEAN